MSTSLKLAIISLLLATSASFAQDADRVAAPRPAPHKFERPLVRCPGIVLSEPAKDAPKLQKSGSLLAAPLRRPC
jgi:hypothetical protein